MVQWLHHFRNFRPTWLRNLQLNPGICSSGVLIVLHMTCRLQLPSTSMPRPEDLATNKLQSSDQIKQPGNACPAQEIQSACGAEAQIQSSWDPQSKTGNSHLDDLMELEGCNYISDQRARYPSGLLTTKLNSKLIFHKMQAIISLV